MEKNYSSTHNSFDRDLSLPHFDEEATLLSARPVVPLHAVRVEARPRRWVILGLTMLLAILVGAISATLLVQRSEKPPEAAISDSSRPTVLSTGAAGGSTSTSVEVRAPVTRVLHEPQRGTVPGARDSLLKERTTAAMSRISPKPTVSRSSIKRRPGYDRAEDSREKEMELRRAERIDARREARRQHRQKREQRDDDVLRIREIFEGSPRP